MKLQCGCNEGLCFLQMAFPVSSSRLTGPLLVLKLFWPFKIYFEKAGYSPINHTFITLIPKKLGACNFNQFRPISLCNFYYKVIAKILVNKLRPLLSQIIDSSQSAFVPNRWIIENVVLAQEVVHSFKQRKRKKGFMGLKLNFHKAYDYLEWEFICRVLMALGFDSAVVNLIKQCLSTVKFTLLLNGTKSSSFTPSRGIRQGDPLSPYLFILCSEVLARLINKEVVGGNIHGAKIAPSSPGITKLMYADDVVLFCGAKIAEVKALMRCVEKFCGWSGLSVNIEKSRLFVSKGVHSQFCRQVKNMWGFKKLASDVQYLGLPLFLSANKSKAFSFVKERLNTRISGWKSKSLSQMGRSTLIKSVALTSPIYVMAAFKLPTGLCSELDAMVHQFWWSPRKDGNRFFSPMAWSDICKPLADGGLGFRSFESFNEAMIAKLA